MARSTCSRSASGTTPSFRDGVIVLPSGAPPLNPTQRASLLRAAGVSENDQRAHGFLSTIELGIKLSRAMREPAPNSVLRELTALRRAAAAVVETIHGCAPGRTPRRGRKPLSREAITLLENCGAGPTRAVASVRIEGSKYQAGGDHQEHVRGLSFHEACVGVTYLLIHVDDVLRTLSQPGRRPAFHRRVLAQYTLLALRDHLRVTPTAAVRGPFTSTLREVLRIVGDRGKASAGGLPNPDTRDVRELVRFAIQFFHRREGD